MGNNEILEELKLKQFYFKIRKGMFEANERKPRTLILIFDIYYMQSLLRMLLHQASTC